MISRSVTTAVLLAITLPAPALAQFGGILGSKPKPAASDKPSTGCDPAKPKSAGSRMFGSILGSVAGSTLGRTGLGRFVPIPEVAGILTEAIACKLQPKEQKQAADATLNATREGEVGATAAWTSDERPGVSGSSTVAQKTASAGGGSCIMVTDVVIVEGEESRAQKRMCRGPGQARYTLAA